MRTARPTRPPLVPTRSQPALELDFDDWPKATPKAQSEVRLVSRPNLEAPSDEAWAQTMEGAPYVAISPEKLTSLSIGHRAAFLLSRMDGVSDLEAVVAVSAMPRDEALRLTRELFESSVIGFRRED